MQVEKHIAETTAATMNQKEKFRLSLRIYARKNWPFLIAVVLGMSYGMTQIQHQDKVDMRDARYVPIDPSGELPASYRCPTNGTVYHSALDFQQHCPGLHRT